MTARNEPAKALCAISKPLGDSVCLLPELRWLAERHGGRVDVLVKTGLQAELYRDIPYIGRVIRLERWRLPFWLSPRQLKVISELGSGGYDRFYLFFETDAAKRRKFRRLLGLAGVEEGRIEEGFPEGEKARFLELPPGLSPAYRLSPILEASETEKASVRERLERECGWRGEPLAVCHPGNGLTAGGKGGRADNDPRHWPLENWRLALEAILAESDAVVVLTGVGAERKLNDAAIPSGAGARIFNWAGRLSLRELLALLSLADSCVSVDTGVMHAAPAAGCPTLGLFGPRDPRFMERCSPKGWAPTFTLRGSRELSPGQAGGMSRIRPGSVVRLWKALPGRLSGPSEADCLVRHFSGEEEEPEVKRMASF